MVLKVFHHRDTEEIFRSHRKFDVLFAVVASTEAISETSVPNRPSLCLFVSEENVRCFQAQLQEGIFARLFAYYLRNMARAYFSHYPQLEIENYGRLPSRPQAHPKQAAARRRARLSTA
jgi:hypothetical protein